MNWKPLVAMEIVNAINTTASSAPKTVAIAQLLSSDASLEVVVAELPKSQTNKQFSKLLTVLVNLWLHKCVLYQIKSMHACLMNYC